MSTLEIVTRSISYRKYFEKYFELAKVRITLFVAISTSVGFIMQSSSITPLMFITSFAVFLLASGSSALNHFQESASDALMQRTKNRPIPSGEVLSSTVMKFGIILIVPGSLILYFSSNLIVLGLGLIAVIWYNLIYTPLKKVTAFAIIPGSFIGSIPPLIGWTAAGGYILDIEILTFASFFFIWQIPHFWLLLLIFDDDYRTAGFPTLTKMFDQNQLSRITFFWIISLAFSSLLIPLFGMNYSIILLPVLLITAAVLLWNVRYLLRKDRSNKEFKQAFMALNFYVLVVVTIISFDKLILGLT